MMKVFLAQITTHPGDISGNTVKIIKGLIEEKEAELEEELADQPPKHNCKLYFICEDEGHCMHYKKPHLGSNCINLDLDTMTCSSTLARANLCVLELKSMKFSDEQIREMLE